MLIPFALALLRTCTFTLRGRQNFFQCLACGALVPFDQTSAVVQKNSPSENNPRSSELNLPRLLVLVIPVDFCAVVGGFSIVLLLSVHSAAASTDTFRLAVGKTRALGFGCERANWEYCRLTVGYAGWRPVFWDLLEPLRILQI